MQEKIKLVSSAGTGHYYTTAKNKRTHPEKMERNKYDPVVRKHVPYKESKTSIGINLYDNTYSKYEFLAHNWFTNNLYFTGSFRRTLITLSVYKMFYNTHNLLKWFN